MDEPPMLSLLMLDAIGMCDGTMMMMPSSYSYDI